MIRLRLTDRCKADILDMCAWCGEAVRDDDDRFEFPDGTVVHDDCMLPYVEDRYYHRGQM